MGDSKTGIGFIYNGQMASARDLAHSLIRGLELGDRAWTCPADGINERSDELASSSLLVISGGDGTVLRTTRVAAPYGLPILGINLGKVGFMSELEVGEAPEGIAGYLSGGSAEAWIDERMMVRVSVALSGGDRVPEADALNEVVLSRGQSARLLNVEASVDDAALATYRADGVMVSTATGSTGYAMAAGGPVMSPRLGDMFLTPVAPHMCLETGLVLPGESSVSLRVVNEADTLLSADGFPVSRLGPGDVVTIRRSPHRARFVRLRPPGDFFATLTRRLGIIDRT